MALRDHVDKEGPSDDGSLASNRCGPSVWLGELRESYGAKLLVMIFCAQHTLKGFVGGGGHSGFAGAPMDFIYRDHGLSGPQLQVYVSAALIPWSVKALMGSASDGLPLLGYHKAPYICATSVLSACACAFLGLQHDLSLEFSTTCFFMIFLQIAFCDTMVEAKYSEKVKAVPEKGPDLVSFVWFGISLGHVLSTALVGPMIAHFGPQSCYLFALPFTCAILWPTLRNFLEETKAPSCCEQCKIGGAKFAGQRPILILALVQGLCGLALAIFTMCVRSVRWNFVFAASIGCLTTALFSIVCRPVIAKMNLFFFLNTACALGTHGAAFYFFTDSAKQYPAGPHFSTSFYVTGVGLVASGCNIAGMALYTRWGKQMRYRTILGIGSITTSLTQLLNVVCFARINISLGIPDELFMVTSSALQNVVSQFAWMPGTCALAQLVPDGLESTMYALVGSSWNLGMALANYGGAFLLEELGVRPSGEVMEGGQFDKLWLAALIAACGPSLPLVLLPVLIPDVYQTDKLLVDNMDNPTVGSLLEHWQQRTIYRHLDRHRVPEVQLPEVNVVGAQSVPPESNCSDG